MQNPKFWSIEEWLGAMAYTTDYNGNLTCRLPGSILGYRTQFGEVPDGKRIEIQNAGYVRNAGAGPVLTEEGYKAAAYPPTRD